MDSLLSRLSLTSMTEEKRRRFVPVQHPWPTLWGLGPSSFTLAEATWPVGRPDADLTAPSLLSQVPTS